MHLNEQNTAKSPKDNDADYHGVFAVEYLQKMCYLIFVYNIHGKGKQA